MRIILDAPVLTEPRTWKISKINRLASNGLCLATCAQDEYNANTDYVELDDNGNVIGMWADYYSSNIEPTEKPDDTKDIDRVEVKFAGTKPEVKIGGSYKTFTATLYKNDVAVPISALGLWEYFIDGNPVNSLIDNIDDGAGKNKVKFIGDLSYIGKVLTIKYTSADGESDSVDVEIKRL